jgi:hypothetical protein
VAGKDLVAFLAVIWHGHEAAALAEGEPTTVVLGERGDYVASSEAAHQRT